MRIYSFRSLWLVLFVMALILLSACNNQVISPVTETVVVVPTEAPTSTQEIVPTDAIDENQNVMIYLVALEDNGQSGKEIGCDDSLIPVIVINSSAEGSPWNALAALLDLKETYFGDSGLYNALYQSNLSLQSYTVDGKNVVVYLEGEMMLGGVCDNPRMEEQILGTIGQGGIFDDIEVYVNGVLLQDALSLK